MRKNNVVIGSLVLTMTVLAVGCAKPPQQELDSAKAAVTAAEQAEAPKYAPDAWDKAQQAMNAVNAEMEAQNAKFALFRSYTKAKQLIADATNAANAAGEMDAGDLIAGQYINDLQKCRRKPKDLRKDLEVMKGNMDGYHSQVTEIEGAFGREDYFGAKSQAESLKGQVDTMVNELEAAKKKLRC